MKDNVDGLLGVASGVGIFNTKHEGAASVAGVKPIEQSGARTSDVKKPGWTWRKSDTNAHDKNDFKIRG